MRELRNIQIVDNPVTDVTENRCLAPKLLKKIFFMEYVDQVFVQLKDREPCKVLMASLKDSEKFILAVKELIDYGYLFNIEFNSDYSEMTIQEKFPFKSDKNKYQTLPKKTFYDK